MAKIRYNMEAVPATVASRATATARSSSVSTRRSARSRPGQSLVLYDGDTVLGGATIQRRL